jgi:hypothetical protein
MAMRPGTWSDDANPVATRMPPIACPIEPDAQGCGFLKTLAEIYHLAQSMNWLAQACEGGGQSGIGGRQSTTTRNSRPFVQTLREGLWGCVEGGWFSLAGVTAARRQLADTTGTASALRGALGAQTRRSYFLGNDAFGDHSWHRILPRFLGLYRDDSASADLPSFNAAGRDLIPSLPQ